MVVLKEKKKKDQFYINYLFKLGYSTSPIYTNSEELTDVFPVGFFFGRVVKISFQSNSTVCQEGKHQCGSYTGKSNLNLASRFTQESPLLSYSGS